MPNAKELVAYDHSVLEVERLIGADWLMYQDLEDLYDAVNEAAAAPQYRVERFEDSVFTGDYITGDISESYLKALAEARSEQAKLKRHALENDLDLA